MLPIFNELDEQRNNNNEGASTNMDRVQKWRLALTEVATLSGWHLKKGGHEATAIQSIVKMVSKQLDRTTLHVAEHPVGLASRVDYYLIKLSLESNDVRILGLHGMGGIGKTTTAKALYNRCVSQFDGNSFLLNVRETSKKHNLAHLQETLLFEILGDQKHLMGNFEKGISLIKKRLCGKKVLIVIDDVDRIEQLHKLAGGLEWFGSGSRIIVTTRDSHLLKLHRVTTVHEINELKDDEAMELFSWHAFKKPRPGEAYIELSNRILKHAQGLPLALEVLGSSLYGRDIPMWEDVLKKLKRCPNNEITDVLKVSYDGLDSEEKAIFIDIACFLKGKNKDEVIKFLDACGFHANFGLQRLIEKSLVSDNFTGILEMHDLLEKMGTQIAHDESSRNPAGRRLCIQDVISISDDIPGAFLEDKGPHDIEGVLLDFHGEEEAPLKLLENMKKLRLLIIHNVRVTRMPKSLPNNIRWLEWHKCPLNTILPGFLPAKLVILEMPCSRIMSFDKGFASNSKGKNFPYLTRMDFSVDFSAIPNLERLNFSRCAKLKEIDKSIGSLKKLEYMYLNGCSTLASIPNLVGTQRLVMLKLNGCSKLEKLPNLPATLAIIDLSRTGVKEISSFIGNLTNLLLFNASNCKNLVSISSSIFKLPRLHGLVLSNCPKLAKFSEAESSTVSADVHDLILSVDDFVVLPKLINRLCPVSSVGVGNIKWLPDPYLSNGVVQLPARARGFLEVFSPLRRILIGDFSNRHKLAEKGMQSWTRVILQNLSQNLSSISSRSRPLEGLAWYVFPEAEGKIPECSLYWITLPGNEIPGWFSYTIECEGNASSFNFKLPPPVINDDFIGLAACAVFQVNPEFESRTCDFKNLLGINDFNVGGPTTSLLYRLESEHMWLCFSNASSLRKSLQAQEVSCKFRCDPKEALVYKRLGVHFIYKNDGMPEIIVESMQRSNFPLWHGFVLKRLCKSNSPLVPL